MHYRGKLLTENCPAADVGIRLQTDGIVLKLLDGSGEEQHWDLMRIDREASTGEGLVLLRYNSTPVQRLQVTDVSFGYSLRTLYPLYGFSKDRHISSSSKLLITLLVTGLVLITAAVVAYLWLLPRATDYLALKIPLRYEQRLGDEIAASLLQGEEQNSKAAETLNRFFLELGFNRGDSVSLHVVNSNVVNAFALPGGTIVVYDEMIRKTHSPDELAALLAHEYAHVHFRHPLRGMAKGLSSWLLLLLITGGNSELLGVIAEQAEQLRQMKFSRDFEKQADAHAIFLLKRHHLNPEGMVKLMQTLQEQESLLSGELPRSDFLSTHPLTESRIRYAKQQAALNDYTVSDHHVLDSLYAQLQTEVKTSEGF